MVSERKPALNGQRITLLWLIAVVVMAEILLLLREQAAAFGTLAWGALLAVFFACRPTGMLSHETLKQGMQTVITGVVCAATVLLLTLPMGLSPVWNGEVPEHRNQYEKMAQSLLEGKLYLDYGDDTSALEALDNPYDPEARSEAGVPYRWDHAWYDGHYYMYFGVVPAILVFAPFQAITGTPLTTYHATQLFTAAAVIGLFFLFRLLTRRFFKHLSYGMYLFLSVAVSLMSLWYGTATPALYCTAITAAVALMVWSLYFFIRAVYVEPRENRQLVFAGLGALLGALVFGCRPTVALANLVVIPLLVVFLRSKQITPALLGKLALAALPYVVVGVALMWYNAARFDNPFEFGQTYQLTVADQTALGGFPPLKELFQKTWNNFFEFKRPTATFPFVDFSGAVCNFPMVLLSLAVVYPPVWRQLREQRLRLVTLTFFALPVIITVLSVLWSPFLMERYRMDIYFLMGILCFLMVGSWHNSITPRRRPLLSSGVMVCAVITSLTAVLFFLVPSNYSPTACDPRLLSTLENILLFWKW